MHAYMHPCIHASIYIHTYIPTYIHTYLHTYIHTYLPTYIPTYIHTYLHTYIHLQIYVYIYYINILHPVRLTSNFLSHWCPKVAWEPVAGTSDCYALGTRSIQLDAETRRPQWFLVSKFWLWANSRCLIQFLHLGCLKMENPPKPRVSILKWCPCWEKSICVDELLPF